MAHIVVVGGTGYAGSALAREAASRGHTVTALSRSAPDEPTPGVSYVLGDAALEGVELARGADVVIGALSPRGGSEGTLVATYMSLADSIAPGSRFVVIGGFVSLRPAAGEPRRIDSGDIPDFVLVKAREVDSVRRALLARGPDDVDWLFVSPAGDFGPQFAHQEALGRYRTGSDVALYDEDGVSAISAADLAIAVLDAIEAAEHHRAHLHFAY